ncbi:uncharacterized protein LOC127832174 isoform X2 [Dreissena polymorpha]|uniref:SAM domain-containing protein n=2 Tax=Dreissena polymorpha TaxID=45954 RepID=A0A9D4JWM3_DREPO|nr:uncharacterized protein LOC127832174 isoform X2 [Dreissena polymorpha]KAH3823117.1 hypothetical protein DPMN_124916 [Dreissena polymorpha]
MIDPRVSGRIKELYHQGVHTIQEMRLHINGYIHEICGGPPDPCNARFRVDYRTLRTHMDIARPKPLNPKCPKDLPDDVIAGASIHTYLNFHGFSRYVSNFQAHQIYDALQLVHVTNEDTIRMKIKKDHRKVILTRIKWLRNKFLKSAKAEAISLQEEGTRLGLENNEQKSIKAEDQTQKNIRAGSQAMKKVRVKKQAKKNIEAGNHINVKLDSKQQTQEIFQME